MLYHIQPHKKDSESYYPEHKAPQQQNKVPTIKKYITKTILIVFNCNIYYFMLFLDCWFDKVIFYYPSPWSPAPRIQVTEDPGSEISYSEIETAFTIFSPCGLGSQKEGDHCLPFSLLRKKEVMRHSL